MGAKTYVRLAISSVCVVNVSLDMVGGHAPHPELVSLSGAFTQKVSEIIIEKIQITRYRVLGGINLCEAGYKQRSCGKCLT